DYGYGEVAAIVGTSEGNARQLTARARRHVAEGRPRFTSSPEQRDALAGRFLAAVPDGDGGAPPGPLPPGAEGHGGGGGQVPALARSLHGRSRVARTLLAWARQGARLQGAEIAAVTVNGQPGAEIRTGGGELISVMAFDIADGRVQAIRSIVNPDKLRHLGP